MDEMAPVWATEDKSIQYCIGVSGEYFVDKFQKHPEFVYIAYGDSIPSDVSFVSWTVTHDDEGPADTLERLGLTMVIPPDDI